MLFPPSLTRGSQMRNGTDHSIILQTPTEAITVDREDVEGIKPSQLSIMPEGILDTLNSTEARDLVAYLIQRTQVSLPRVEH